MHKFEPIKRLVEKATGAVPSSEKALACVKKVAARRMTFRKDGYIPNSKLPLLYYPSVVRLSREYDPAAVLRLGGNKGKTVKVKSGDVIEIPSFGRGSVSSAREIR